MKLHLEPKITISSVPPQIEAARHGDALFYYSSPHLYVASISTSRILRKLKYEDVQVVAVHEYLLYLCSSDIYILDPGTCELLDVIKLSRALVSKAVFSGSSILVSKVNNRIVRISDRKVTAELSVDSLCEGLFLSQLFYGYYGSDSIAVFSSSGLKVCEQEMSGIAGAMALGDKVFALDAHGTLIELISGSFVETGMEVRLCRMFHDAILAASGDVIYRLDYNGAVVSRHDFAEMIESYSGSVRDMYGEMSCSEYQAKKIKASVGLGVSSNDHESLSTSCGEVSGDDSSQDSSMLSERGALEITYFGEDFVRTSENDIVFVSEDTIVKIISFVDDVTDFMEYEGRLILTTSSGVVKYTAMAQYAEGEYVCDSKIVRIGLDSITCARITGDIMITGSKDRTCQVFRLASEDSNIVFARVHEFRSFQAPIVSLALWKSVLAVASSDNILQVYRGGSPVPGGPEECMLYFSTFENISTQHAHSKHITQVAVTPDFIITSSMDRTSKVFDHNGTLVRTLHSDKILNISHDAEHIAISSHKAIRVYRSPSLAQNAVFQSQRPVLSSCFHSGYFLGVTDVLRVYDLDKRKCVKSYDLGLVNCWSFNYPYLCAENKIVVLVDRSMEMHRIMLSSARELKESKVLVDRFLEEGKYREAVEVLLRRGDSKRAHKAVVEGFYSDRSLGFLSDVLGNGDLRAKMVECILQNTGLKYSEVFNAVARKLLRTSLDKAKKERMLQIVRKHAGAVDETFVDLLSLDIFNKRS